MSRADVHQHCKIAAASRWHCPAYTLRRDGAAHQVAVTCCRACCHDQKATERDRQRTRNPRFVDVHLSNPASGVPGEAGWVTGLPGSARGSHGGLAVQLNLLVCSQNWQAVQLSKHTGERFAQAGCCTVPVLQVRPDTCLRQAGKGSVGPCMCRHHQRWPFVLPCPVIMHQTFQQLWGRWGLLQCNS